MKHTCRFLALLLAMLLLLAALPSASLAATKVKALKYNTWYSTQDPAADNRKVYRLKLNAATVVYVNWKNANANSDFAEVDFCRDTDCTYVVDGMEMFYPASGREGFLLYPGTYYVGIFDIKKGAKVRLSAVKASRLKKSNTSSGRAISLARGKKAEAVFTRSNKGARWYKLKLTHKQVIKLYVNSCFLNHAGELSLYNSKLKEVALKEDWNNRCSVSKQKLAKGTYYIKLSTDTAFLDACGNYARVCWK